MSALKRAALAAWLAPEYPLCSEAQAKALRAGTSPRELARQADPDSDLTSAEAHRWLAGAPGRTPLEWLSGRLLRNLSVREIKALRSWAVARWLGRVLGSPAEKEALLRVREFAGPAEQRIRVRFVDRVDEVQDVDLDRGPRTGVQRVFERAAQRVGSARLEELAHDHGVLADPPAAWPRSLGARARVLVTPAELVAEGREMGHCVGGYTHAVSSRRSVIVSIRCGGHRSTAELSPAGGVLQHRGRRNTEPAPVCWRVLKSVLRRIGGGAS